MSLQWNTFFLIYFNLLLVSCARNSSLTFVIDNSLSMYDDISQVKQAIPDIMDIIKTEKASEIEDVVLVTFNDPEVVLKAKTSDKDTLLQALNQTTVHDRLNIDCAEFALSGIEKALEESRPDSFVFVFTDSSAIDFFKLSSVISLCGEKQSKVVFVLTGDCNNTLGNNYEVYHKIAKACYGQVFRVHKNEVQDVLETVKETVKGQRTVVTSKVVSAFRTWHPIPFMVDDLSEYVVVSTSGKNVDLIITNNTSVNLENKMRVDRIMWKSSGKVVKFQAPKPGTYYAWVNEETDKSDISVMVYARTDFYFNYGFSSNALESLEGTWKQPIKSESLYLSIEVNDPAFIVDVKCVELLKEQVIAYRIPLNKVQGNYYITGKFVIPSSTFEIQVIGINKKSGNAIRRLARTNINPQD